MMGKIIFLFLLMGFLVEGAYAQRYKATLETYISYNLDPLDRLDIYLEFASGERMTIIPSQYSYSNKELFNVSYFVNEVPRWLVIGRSCDGCVGYPDPPNGWSGVNTARVERRIPISYCENSLVTQTNLHRFTKLNLKIYPEVSIYPSGAGHTIASEDKFELSATAGFPAAVYQWQYNIGNGWVAIPNTYGRNSIVFTGHDLIGAQFDGLYGKRSIHFRLKPLCEQYATPITTASLKPSAPHIVSITPISNTCFGEIDGSVRIQFDRALNSGETLNLSLRGTIEANDRSRDNISLLDEANAFVWPKDLAPDTYSLSIIGTLNGMTTYTDGSHHVGSVTLKSPPPVTFGFTHKNVNCFAGNDANIMVTASGGVGNYTVGYKKKEDADFMYQVFHDPTKHLIKGLTSGIYYVCLYDGNGCAMKSKKGEEEIKVIEIKQPLVAVSIKDNQAVDPRAFGYTDGWATATVVGGTPIDGNRYHVTWTDSSGTVLTSKSITTNPFTTQLYSIGKGDYILTVTDVNYASALDGAQTGCIIQETIHLDEPPKLEVAVHEDHFINCKGMSNGQLKAIAKGGIQIPRKCYIYEWFRQEGSEWIMIKSRDGDLAKGLHDAVYKIKITDANGISKESEPFHLVEPEALKVALHASPAKCSGSNTGNVSAIITGGSPPYHMEWNTGAANTTTLENILAGNYHIWVTDTRACQAEATIAVTTPRPIELRDLVIKEPSCYQSSDGYIRFNTAGGTPPYRYEWSYLISENTHMIWDQGSNMPRANGLHAGTYTLLLTDAEGCTLERTFDFNNPDPVMVDLGPNRTLCTDQVWVADASIPDRRARYQWTGPNAFTSQQASVSLKNEGTYSVVVTDSKGCQGSDAITIHRNDVVIEAEYTVPTHVWVDESIIFVNVNNVEPDNVEWIFPQTPSVKVLNKNKKLAELVFANEGSYDVAIRSTTGACEKIFKKSITVLNKDEVHHLGTTTAPFIKELKVGPNSSGGSFMVDVSLERVAPVNLRLVHVHTGETIDLKKQMGSDRYTISYNLQLDMGAYVLILETGKENRLFRMMVL